MISNALGELRHPMSFDFFSLIIGGILIGWVATINQVFSPMVPTSLSLLLAATVSKKCGSYCKPQTIGLVMQITIAVIVFSCAFEATAPSPNHTAPPGYTFGSYDTADFHRLIGHHQPPTPDHRLDLEQVNTDARTKVSLIWKKDLLSVPRRLRTHARRLRSKINSVLRRMISAKLFTRSLSKDQKQIPAAPLPIISGIAQYAGWFLGASTLLNVIIVLLIYCRSLKVSLQPPRSARTLVPWSIVTLFALIAYLGLPESVSLSRDALNLIMFLCGDIEWNPGPGVMFVVLAIAVLSASVTIYHYGGVGATARALASIAASEAKQLAYDSFWTIVHGSGGFAADLWDGLDIFTVHNFGLSLPWAPMPPSDAVYVSPLAVLSNDSAFTTVNGSTFYNEKPCNIMKDSFAKLLNYTNVTMPTDTNATFCLQSYFQGAESMNSKLDILQYCGGYRPPGSYWFGLSAWISWWNCVSLLFAERDFLSPSTISTIGWVVTVVTTAFIANSVGLFQIVFSIVLFFFWAAHKVSHQVIWLRLVEYAGAQTGSKVTNAELRDRPDRVLEIVVTSWAMPLFFRCVYALFWATVSVLSWVGWGIWNFIKRAASNCVPPLLGGMAGKAYTAFRDAVSPPLHDLAENPEYTRVASTLVEELRAAWDSHFADYADNSLAERQYTVQFARHYARVHRNVRKFDKTAGAYMGRIDGEAEEKDAILYLANREKPNGQVRYKQFLDVAGRSYRLRVWFDKDSPETLKFVICNDTVSSKLMVIDSYLLGILAFGTNPSVFNELDNVYLDPSRVSAAFASCFTLKKQLEGEPSIATEVASSIADSATAVTETLSRATSATANKVREVARSLSPKSKAVFKSLAERMPKFQVNTLCELASKVVGTPRLERFAEKGRKSSNYTPSKDDCDLIERISGLSDNQRQLLADQIPSPTISPSRTSSSTRNGRNTEPRDAPASKTGHGRNLSPGQNLLAPNREGKNPNGAREGICGPRSAVAIFEHLANIVLNYANVNGREAVPLVEYLADQSVPVASKLHWLRDEGFCHLNPKEGQDPFNILNYGLKQACCMVNQQNGFANGWNELFHINDYSDKIHPAAVAVIATTTFSADDEHCFAVLKNRDGSWTKDDNSNREEISLDDLLATPNTEFFSVFLKVPVDSIYPVPEDEQFKLVPVDVSPDENIRSTIVDATRALIITCKNVEAHCPAPSDAVSWLADDVIPFRRVVEYVSKIVKEESLLHCDEVDQCKTVKCGGECKTHVGIIYNRILRNITAETNFHKALKSYIARDNRLPKKNDTVPFMAVARNDSTWYVLRRLPGTFQFVSQPSDGTVTVFDESELRPVKEGGLVHEVMFCWLAAIKRSCNAAPASIISCDNCGRNSDNHGYSKVIRHCPSCAKTLLGKCTGLAAEDPAHWNERINPNNGILTAFNCPACSKAGTDELKKSEASKSSPSSSSSSQSGEADSSDTASVNSTTSSNKTKAATASAEDTRRASSSSSSNHTKSDSESPASSKKSAPAQKSAPTPKPQCAGCTVPFSKHAYRNSVQTCSKCKTIRRGRCHGREFHVAAQANNNDPAYVCPTCNTPAAATASANPTAPPTATPACPTGQLNVDSPSASNTASPDRQPSPKREPSESPPSQNQKQETGKKFEPHPPKPSQKCAGCDAPSHGHRFARSFRQCCKCTLHYYGPCHGDEYRKGKGGLDQNHVKDWVCTKCLPEAKQQTAKKLVDSDDGAAFCQVLCESCEKRKFDHHLSSSWRQCKSCSSFTFGECHKGDRAIKHNKAQGFECATCRGDTDAPAVASRRNQEACKKICTDVEVPEDYNEQNNPVLGEPTQDDVKKEMKSNEKTHGLKEPSQEQQGFRFGLRSSPTAALVPGENFLEINISDKMAKEAAKGISEDTAKFHIKLLRQFQTHLKNSPKWHRLPLTRAATRFLLLITKVRKLQPQTLHRYAAGLHGAMASLDLYTDSKVGVLFAQDTYWRHMMKYWRTMSNQAQPHNQAAVLVNEIEIAVSAAPNLAAKAALALMWSTAGRFSDIVNIRKKHIKWNPHTKALMVTIQEGKMMKHVQPYTVDTKVHSSTLAAAITDHLNSIQDPNHHLFPFKTTPRKKQLDAVNTALKTVNEEYSTRAIRRGALQAMACKGVKLDTIMQYSGHKSKETCMRYLDWGRLCADHNKAAKQAARHLHPVSSQQ